jgi:hypothetical protein
MRLSLILLWNGPVKTTLLDKNLNIVDIVDIQEWNKLPGPRTLEEKLAVLVLWVGPSGPQTASGIWDSSLVFLVLVLLLCSG